MGANSHFDMVRVGAFSIEKRRWGGFSLGGYNQLVIHELSITFPYEQRGETDDPSFSLVENNQIIKVRSALEELLRGYPSFSAVQIYNLQLDKELSNGALTNVLYAEFAQLKTERRLELHNGSFTSEMGIRVEESTAELDLYDLSVHAAGICFKLY